jgi:hypothetical protein
MDIRWNRDGIEVDRRMNSVGLKKEVERVDEIRGLPGRGAVHL